MGVASRGGRDMPWLYSFAAVSHVDECGRGVLQGLQGKRDATAPACCQGQRPK